MAGIFVSHTHSDRPIVDALAGMVKKLFGTRVPVNYSSSKELDEGISAGRDWFRWIIEQVRNTDVAVIILTPGSIQKPWVVWEAGAVSGAALSISEDEGRVLPITFGLKSDQVPTPFAGVQVVNGIEEQDITLFMQDLFTRFGKEFSPKETMQFGIQLAVVVREFIADINQILLKLPHAVTEAAIQEWLARLDELETERRYSEAIVIEDWLDVAFGRDAQSKQRPLDLRIHRRLGQLYATAGQPNAAARQFELGRQLAPRDIFLLRRLGKAYLDQRDTVRAASVLTDIEQLDKTAFTRNSENAALKARWCELEGNIVGAREVLEIAYNHNPSAYYLGDRLGQMLLTAGDMTKAKDIYRQVRTNIQKLREKNVWTHATALTAAIVLDEPTEIQQAIEELRKASPSRQEMESIERGVEQVLKVLGRDSAVLAALQGMEPRRQAA